MASSLLPFLAWSFLPDLATNYTQRILYGLLYRAGTPHPAPGTPQHTRHRQRIHLAVLLSYFAYTLYEAHWELTRQPTLYEILGLPPGAPDNAVRNRYKRLSLQFHPDKLMPGATYDEQGFMVLTTARDVLLDPVKRFAYERFGIECLQWQHLHTIRDYVEVGMKQSVFTYYLGFGVVMAVFQWIGWGSHGIFWRWWAMAALAAFEVAAVTRQGYPQDWLLRALPLPTAVGDSLAAFIGQWGQLLGWKPYLPFQTVSFLRRASLTFFVGLSRVGPLLRQMAAMNRAGTLTGMSAAAAAETGEDVRTMRLIQRLEQTVHAQGVEAGRLVALGSVAFAPSTVESVVQIKHGGSGRGMEDLRAGLKNWIVKNALRSDPEVARATKRAIARRNGGARVEEIEDEDVDVDGGVGEPVKKRQ